jgi:uncharacterized protein YcbK (DUF882 family)
MPQTVDTSRRNFIKTGLIGAATLATTPAFAWPSLQNHKMKELAFHNLHTDERLRVTFWKRNNFDYSALAKINHILRDFRTGETYPIATNLITLLHDLQGHLETDAPVEIISGYRSPKTNALLAQKSGGVAKRSLHMQGLATDIRMSGVSLRKVRNEALLMRRGGVGFYPDSNFVHVDVGRVRKWGAA